MDLIFLIVIGGLVCALGVYLATLETRPVNKGGDDPSLAKYTLECARQKDGRFVVRILALPVVLTQGETPEEAGAKAQAWVLRILADRLDKGEAPVHNLHFELRLPATTAVAPENILTQAASA